MSRRRRRLLFGMGAVVATYAVSYAVLRQGGLMVHSLAPGRPNEATPARHEVNVDPDKSAPRVVEVFFKPAMRVEQAIRNRLDRQSRLEEALREAVYHGESAAIRRLIAQGADANGVSARGVRLLDEAVQDGPVACAEALIAGGADVNWADSGGLTALHHAAQAPQATTEPGMVRVLIRAGADPLAKDRRGRTPMDVGAENHNTTFCKALAPYLPTSGP